MTLKSLRVINTWPPALLSAARLQGTLIPYAAGFRPVGWPDTPITRCASLGHFLTSKFAAAELTAAWIHGASQSSGRPLRLITRVGRAPTVHVSSTVSYSEFSLLPDELMTFAGFAVTTPLRTAYDLVRARAAYTPERQAAVTRLLDLAGVSESALIERVQHSSYAERARVNERLITSSRQGN